VETLLKITEQELDVQLRVQEIQMRSVVAHGIYPYMRQDVSIMVKTDAYMIVFVVRHPNFNNSGKKGNEKRTLVLLSSLSRMM
jgi:hypothetical protein